MSREIGNKCEFIAVPGTGKGVLMVTVTGLSVDEANLVARALRKPVHDAVASAVGSKPDSVDLAPDMGEAQGHG